MKQHTILWKAILYPGMEYLSLEERTEAVEVESVVMGIVDRTAFRLDYRLTCEPSYAIRSLNLALADGRNLRLVTDAQGHWFDADGSSLAEFDGCLDIDISVTPFTNTLPIRRVQWQPGQSEVFRMVYIPVPDLSVRVVQQRYTCMEQSADGAAFRYESLDSGFTALLPVDADGFVLDYPKIWERAFPRLNQG